MKKSIALIMVALLIHCISAHAGSPSNTYKSLYNEPISFSQKFKNELTYKIEYENGYAKDYFKGLVALLRAEKATTLAFYDLEQKVKTVERKMYVLISKTGRLPDETPVFISKNEPSKYYSIRGRLISDNEIRQVVKGRDIVFWEDYLTFYNERKEHMKEKEEVVKYRDNTLLVTRKKMPNIDALSLSLKRQKEWAEYRDKYF